MDKTADEALAEQTGNKAGKLEAAEDFLQFILADGPLTETEIRKKAGERHRSRTLRRAKEQSLALSQSAVGRLAGDGQWTWRLPEIERTEQISEDLGEPERMKPMLLSSSVVNVPEITSTLALSALVNVSL